MKTLFKLLLLLMPVLVQAKDIPVSPGGITAAMNNAVSGDRLILANGSFSEKFNWKPGVSLVGQGAGKTVFNYTGFEWYNGCIDAAFDVTTDMKGAYATGITFKGNSGQAWSAFRLTNAANLKIYNCEFEGFFQSAVELVGGRNSNQGVKNVLLYNLTITDCSNETTSGSLGNILMYGYNSDITIRKCKITHTGNYDKGTSDKGQYGQKASGYGIKAMPNYEGSTDIGGKLTRVVIDSCTITGKYNAPWANYTAPNISIEFWNVQTESCDISKNVLSCSISTEKENNPKPTVSVWIHDNTFNPAQGVSSTIELALSNAIVQNNTFNYTGRTGIWGMFGEFNNGKTLTGIKVLNNTFNMGNISTSVFVYTSPLDGFLVQGNKWNGTGKPTLFEFRRANSNGSKNITIAGNSFPQGFNDFKYAEGAATQRPGNVVVTDSPVVTPPVVQPPVVEPPVVTPPTTITKTITITKSVTLGNPVWVKDEAKKQYTITIPYTETETKTEQ